MPGLPARSIRLLARPWVDRLAHYRQHGNAEHAEALIEDTLRFVGIHLEGELSRSDYWAGVPLARRVAVLLFLVDRGAVVRTSSNGRYVFEVADDAETWAAAQPALAPYLPQTLEMLSALRHYQLRRLRSRD